MKIIFASECSFFRFNIWQVTLTGTRKLCLTAAFPLGFSPGLLINCLTPLRCSGSAAFTYSSRCFTQCFEFQVPRLILFGMWVVAFAPSVGLGRGSWEAAVAAWGPWTGTWISSWTPCGNKKCWMQRTVTGDVCVLRWWPNFCSLNCPSPAHQTSTSAFV